MPGEFAIGTIVSGQYRIISPLGQGGMGLTYRAWDLDSSRPVVLKHPRREMLEKPGFIERFEREARLMAALTHPNVVPITKIGEHDRVPYLTMPFLPGGSLSHHRVRDTEGRPRPMLPSTLHLWLPQIAEALDYVHSCGIVHRDVKPANVFFNGFWHAYLGDFGIAKIVGETAALEKEQTLTATSMMVGTHEYMAPEMFTPKASITGQADQYALAVMVYEILAGRRPFTGDRAHLIVEVTTRRIPSLSDMRLSLPERLEAAVYRGLSKRPDERFENCREFVRSALADVPGMEDEPGLARLACPGCGNVLKLKETVAGRLGRCPRCQSEMMVAHDFSALWLLNEEASRTTDDTTGATSQADSLESGEEPSWQIVATPGTSRPGEQKQVPWISSPSFVRAALAAAAIAMLMCVEAVVVTRFARPPLVEMSTLLSEPVGVSQEPRAASSHALSSQPRVLLDKTLVAWLTLATLEQRGGGILSLENSRCEFDAIVFGEAVPRRWLVGSDYTRRWPPVPGSMVEETVEPDQLVQIAIVYRGTSISFFRDGVQSARYDKGASVPFALDDLSVLFGVRAVCPQRVPEIFVGSIDDARIYDTALSVEELQSLRPNEPSSRLPLAWWHFEDGILSDVDGLFSNVAACGNAAVSDGRLVLDGMESFVVCRMPPSRERKQALADSLVFDFLAPDVDAAATRRADERLDLLELVDPERDTASGAWKRIGRELECEGPAVLEIPVRPPHEFEYSIEFTRLGGNDCVALICPVNDTAFNWICAGWGNTISGVDMLAYRRADGNTSTRRRNAWLTNGTRYALTLRVREAALTVTLDNEVVFDEAVDWSAVGLFKDWGVRPYRLGLGAWHSPTRFHKATVAALPPSSKSSLPVQGLGSARTDASPQR